MPIVRIVEAHIRDGKRRQCEGVVEGRCRRRPCGDYTRTMATVEHDDGTLEDLWLCSSCISEIREHDEELEKVANQ